MMFVTASTVAPRSRAVRIAASVSAVSPDWEIPIDEIAGADDRVAVAVLGGDVDLDRHPRPLLDRVAADQAGVVRGSAGDDHDASQAAQELVVDRAEVAEVDPVLAGGALADRLGDGVGLLVDLLEHERLVALLLGGLGVPVDLDDLALERLAVGGLELDARPGAARRVSSSSMYWTRRVSRRNAGIAEAMNCSPSPRPTISGHSLRAPTSSPGSSALIATNA